MSTPLWKILRRRGLEMAHRSGTLTAICGADETAARLLVSDPTNAGLLRRIRRGRKCEAGRATGRSPFLAAVAQAQNQTVTP